MNIQVKEISSVHKVEVRIGGVLEGAINRYGQTVRNWAVVAGRILGSDIIHNVGGRNDCN